MRTSHSAKLIQNFQNYPKSFKSGLIWPKVCLQVFEDYFVVHPFYRFNLVYLVFSPASKAPNVLRYDIERLLSSLPIKFSLAKSTNAYDDDKLFKNFHTLCLSHTSFIEKFCLEGKLWILVVRAPTILKMQSVFIAGRIDLSGQRNKPTTICPDCGLTLHCRSLRPRIYDGGQHWYLWSDL